MLRIEQFKRYLESQIRIPLKICGILCLQPLNPPQTEEELIVSVVEGTINTPQDMINHLIVIEGSHTDY